MEVAIKAGEWENRAVNRLVIVRILRLVALLGKFVAIIWGLGWEIRSSLGYQT